MVKMPCRQDHSPGLLRGGGASEIAVTSIPGLQRVAGRVTDAHAGHFPVYAAGVWLVNVLAKVNTDYNQ